MILSIDLDYILEPCIQLYNDMISGSLENMESQWIQILKARDLERHLSINNDNLNFIIKVLEESTKYVDHVYYSIDHSNIISALGDEIKINNNLKLPTNFINIDHHHDICYSDLSERDVIMFNLVQCNNWVLFLNKFKSIDQYQWIGNENSGEYEGTKPIGLKESKFITKENFDFDCLKECEMLFVTSSDPWIPPMMHEYIIAIQAKLVQLFGDKITYYFNNFETEKKKQEFESILYNR